MRTHTAFGRRRDKSVQGHADGRGKPSRSETSTGAAHKPEVRQCTSFDSNLGTRHVSREAGGRAKAGPPTEASSVDRDVRRPLTPGVATPSVSGTRQPHSENELLRNPNTSAMCYGAVLQTIHWSVVCAVAGHDLPMFPPRQRAPPPDVQHSQSDSPQPVFRCRLVAVNRGSSAWE